MRLRPDATLRTALLLSLALAVALAACGGSAAGDGTSGVRGRVLLGPTCPVERADSPCPDRPLATAVEATDAAGHVVARTTSGEDGRFTLSLRPGRYSLAAATPGLGQSSAPIPVTVAPGRFATVTVSVDSGIR